MESLTPEQKPRLAEVRRLRTKGLFYAKGGRNEEAEAFYRQALHLHEDTLGPQHPDISESLSALIFGMGLHRPHNDIAPLIERSLALLRQRPGPQYRGILQTLDGLASYHHDRGRHADAEPYYQQVLAAREELLGPNHPRIAATLEKYAVLLRVMGRRVEAKAMEGRAKAIRGR